MAVYKCKICGGDLEIQEGMGICECMYCGTKQTLPKINDERRANLYDRANHFRRNNEFDKAMSMYEQILEEDKEDAEAYWSLILCTYGIEYVEDPVSHKRMPTVNRTQLTSVFADENYKAALRYADDSQRQIYEEEAKQIDEIQKGILDISNQEEPYDVFICYKETDQSGKRTPDSVLANDLYHQLTQEGFKVFFARITLEDKLGSAYEPYIFAALNSARVMVVIGTKAEYFNAVWVKNEWSRYLSLIKNGAKKVLIPAYKDMDPYDMPQEFSHLQSQDMSKLGFMQDLLRGIKKLTGTDKAVQSDGGSDGASKDAGTAALLKRAFLFLEDGDFARADEFCENVLNLDPENGEAYLGKLMAGMQIGKREELAQSQKRLDQLDEFSKIMRFGSEALKAEVNGYNQKVIERQEQEAERQRQFQEEEAERQRQLKAELDEQKYQYAIAEIQKAKKSAGLRRALAQLKELSTYKDAAAHIKAAETKLERIVKAERKKRIRLSAATAVAVIIVVILGIVIVNIREEAYRKDVYAQAVKLIQGGKYEEAYNALGEIMDDMEERNAVWTEEMLAAVLNNIEGKRYAAAFEAFEYAESRMTPEIQEEAKDALYVVAKQYIENDSLEKAEQVLVLLINKGFMDSEVSDERKAEVIDALYAAAKQYIENGSLEKAEHVLVLLIDKGFMDNEVSDKRKEEVIDALYAAAKQYAENGQLNEVYQVHRLLTERIFMDSETLDERKTEVRDSLYVAAERYIENGEWEGAERVLIFISDRGFMDVGEERFSENIYHLAKGYLGKEEYAKAYDLLASLNGYADSEDIMVKASLLMQLSTAKVGDAITFGRYEQDYKQSGMEPIEWYVLDIKDNEYMLLSKDVLPNGRQSEDKLSPGIDTCSWENSNMRNWMNNTFYETAFNSEEQKYILSKTLTNDSVIVEQTNDGDFNWSIIDTGNDTVDKVFALSISEISKYSEVSIRTHIYGGSDTLYLLINDPMFKIKDTRLRTLVYDNSSLCMIEASSVPVKYLIDVYNPRLYVRDYIISGGARPAIWISIDAATE